MGFLLAQILLRIFYITIFDFLKDNKFIYVIILIWVTVILFIFTASFFTISKINNNSDNFFNQITNN